MKLRTPGHLQRLREVSEEALITGSKENHPHASAGRKPYSCATSLNPGRAPSITFLATQ